MNHSDSPAGPQQISSNIVDGKGPSTHEDQRQLNQASNFPEGGWRAWSVVLGSWCAMVPSFGLLNTMGVLEALLANNQLKDYSKASIGWIFGVYSFFLYFGSVQVGMHAPISCP